MGELNFKSPNFHLATNEMSDAEADACDHLSNGLRDIYEFASWYWTGVRYFEWARASIKDNTELHDAKGMAARNAALGVNHCINAMKTVRDAAKELPQIKGTFNLNTMEQSITSLEEAFPGYRLIRNAVAHAYELHSTMENFEKNAVSEVLYIQGFFHNNVYIVTKNGKTYGLPLSYEHAVFLRGRIDDYAVGFRTI